MRNPNAGEEKNLKTAGTSRLKAVGSLMLPGKEEVTGCPVPNRFYHKVSSQSVREQGSIPFNVTETRAPLKSQRGRGLKRSEANNNRGDHYLKKGEGKRAERHRGEAAEGPTIKSLFHIKEKGKGAQRQS